MSLGGYERRPGERVLVGPAVGPVDVVGACGHSCLPGEVASGVAADGRVNSLSEIDPWLKYVVYRVAHHVSHPVGAYFDLDAPLISPSCSAHSAYLSSTQAKLGR